MPPFPVVAVGVGSILASPAAVLTSTSRLRPWTALVPSEAFCRYLHEVYSARSFPCPMSLTAGVGRWDVDLAVVGEKLLAGKNLRSRTSLSFEPRLRARTKHPLAQVAGADVAGAKGGPRSVVPGHVQVGQHPPQGSHEHDVPAVGAAVGGGERFSGQGPRTFSHRAQRGCTSAMAAAW